MNPFFVYLIKSTISLALFYIVFKLAVSRDKMHTVNRFVLLGILITSAILPFAEIPVLQENQVIPQIEIFSQIVEAPVFNNPLPAVSEKIQTVQQTNTASINPVLLIYLFVILLLFSRLIVSVFRVLQIIQKAEKQPFKNYILALVKDFIHPFSFLRNIVISEKDYTENKEMVITHEYAHIKHFHAIDLVICELFTAIHWFNPFMWLIRRDLRLIHEYQADQAVLNKGIDATKYQLLVIEKAVGERRFAMANHFKQKPILKRIKMMKKTNLNRWNGLKLLLFVPFSVLLLMAFNKTNVKIPPLENVTEQIIEHVSNVQSQKELTGFVIEIKKDGNYIDNQSCSMEEVVKKARTWQKTGREDILLLTENQLSYTRVDEIRNVLEDAHIYHVNQQIVGSDEIIYPHGDVSKLAKFKQGNWDNWMEKQLTPFFKDKYKEQAYKVKYGFVIDKNGKVSEGRIMKSSNIPELDAEYARILSEIPDWQPSIKNGKPVSVFWTFLGGRKIVTVTNVVEKK
jgi:hypothetical protein